MTKEKLRRELIAARLALSPEEVAARSHAVTRRLTALPCYREAGTVMLYLSFRQEVDTRYFLEHALRDGKRVAAPLTCRQPKQLLPYQVVDPSRDLAPGTWGIREPRPEVARRMEVSELDLVVVPGVAFDVLGNRLGYGGGYYDRLLAQIRPGCVSVALAYELQLKPLLQAEAHDRPLDLVVTEERLIECRRLREGAC